MNIAVIPARAGSKRIPGKNIKSLGGIPLVVHSIITAKHCETIDEVFVSTDSRVVAEISGKAGAKIIWRPEECCTDSAGDFEVLKHAMSCEETGPIYKNDLFIYLRPTTPFRKAGFIDEQVRRFKDICAACGELGPTGARSVERMPESAWKCFKMEGPILYPLDDEMTITDTDRPDQACEATFRGNGYVDICLPETLSKGTAWGNNVFGILTPPVIELDTPEQWEIAELWLQRKGVDL
jgi:CMP-N-acetylneuraminic acid synthetase